MALIQSSPIQQKMKAWDDAGMWKPATSTNTGVPTPQPAPAPSPAPTPNALIPRPPSTPSVSAEIPKPPKAQALTGTAAPRVSNELTSLLSKNSPYMAQARARAKQDANRTGRLNMTLASQAGEEAAIRAGVPIAAQDAGHLQTLNQMTHGTDESLRGAYGQEPLIRGRMTHGTDESLRQITHGTDESIRQAGAQTGFSKELETHRTGEVIRGETARTELQKELNVQQHNQITGRMLTEQANILGRMDESHRQQLETTVIGATNEVQKMVIAEMGAINRTEGLTPEQQQGAIQDVEARAQAHIQYIQNLASAAPNWDPLFAQIPSLDVTPAQGTTPTAPLVTPPPTPEQTVQSRLDYEGSGYEA